MEMGTVSLCRTGGAAKLRVRLLYQLPFECSAKARQKQLDERSDEVQKRSRTGTNCTKNRRTCTSREGQNFPTDLLKSPELCGGDRSVKRAGRRRPQSGIEGRADEYSCSPCGVASWCEIGKRKVKNRTTAKLEPMRDPARKDWRRAPTRRYVWWAVNFEIDQVGMVNTFSEQEHSARRVDENTDCKKSR